MATFVAEQFAWIFMGGAAGNTFVWNVTLYQTTRRVNPWDSKFRRALQNQEIKNDHTKCRTGNCTNAFPFTDYECTFWYKTWKDREASPENFLLSCLSWWILQAQIAQHQTFSNLLLFAFGFGVCVQLNAWVNFTSWSTVMLQRLWDVVPQS
jgi:hypothetical protein